MRHAIYACNMIMRPLKSYIERGTTDEHVLKAVQILNQLEDDELAFIMAKYVTLAKFSNDARIISVPTATELKEHLQLGGKAFGMLKYRTNEKVCNLSYERYLEERPPLY